MKMNITEILDSVVNLGASDLHVVTGAPLYVRINTELQPMKDSEALSLDDVEYFLAQIMDDQQKEVFEVNKELDFSVSLGQKARFRVNAFYQKGYPSIALRLIPMKVPSVKELHLPDIIYNLAELRQGLILVVGPTGHGKSTTIASIIDRINETRAEHIITVEDPIEYIFVNKKSLIAQREMFLDTHSWDISLRSILREDPNIVFIGEMRDAETISATLQIAETGHLVFATLHTNSAAQTVDRIIASFPESKRSEVRMQLAQVIEVVISQRLIYSDKSGVVPANEILLANEAVRNTVREGKTHMLDNIIQTSSSLGMVSLERSLSYLVNDGSITFETAVKFSNRPDELKRLVLRGNKQER
jgi:twitching motility protein PilT